MRGWGRRSLVGAAVGLAAGLLTGAAQPPTSPAVFLNPTIGSPGTHVVASGSGFTAGVDVSLLWDGTTNVGAGTVAADGTVGIGFTVPGGASVGGHSVVLCAFCGQNFEEATAGFQVIQAPTATFTCAQLQNCTATPSKTSPPTSTSTPTSTDSATPLASLTPTASPSPVATDTPSTTPSPRPTNTSTPTPTTTPGPFLRWIRDTIGGITVSLSFPTRTPTSVPVDIELVKIEITQGIQCLNNPDCPDNSVGLYEKRPTLIRAYLRLNSGPATLTNVSGTLCVGSVYDRGCPFPVRPLAPMTLERSVTDPVSFFRGNIKGTLNFIVPSEWIASPSSFFLTVNVNPGGESAVETTYDNNNLLQYVTFNRHRRLDVVFVPFYSNGAIALYDHRWPIVAWLQLALPTNDIRVWTTGMWLVGDLAFNDLEDGGCGKGWTKALDSLEWFRGKNWQIYYGMVDRKSIQDGSPGGCGRYDGAFVSAGQSGLPSRDPGETAAQEIGHNFERHHAPGFGAGNPDPDFPSSIGALDEYGVDIVRMQVYRKDADFDFMGYGGGESSTWTSLYTWRAIEGLMGLAVHETGLHLASPADKLQAESDFLVASGWLTPDAVTIDEGFFHLRLAADSKDTLPEGPYQLELVAADGTVLKSRDFGPASDSDSFPGTHGGFLIREPWVEGTSAVVIRYQGGEMARRTLSSHAPVVRLLEPNGGDNWSDGEKTVRWEASDADGDPLQTMIEYSVDDGATWQTMGMVEAGTSLTMDSSHLPGSWAARIRVVVSDGLQTSSDASDTAFTVSDKTPEVFITSVEEGQRVTQGTPLILMAAGSDPEDGPIGDEAFRWTSDRDGEVGHAGFVTAFDLSLGDHTLVLEASDSAGQVGRHTVHIVVEPAPVLEAQAPGAGPATSIAGLLVVCGALLVGGAFLGLILLRRRQRPA